MAQNKARRRGRRTYEGGLRLSAARRACARPTQTQDTYQAVYNYAADAGGGSQTFAQGDTWRAVLLGTVAAGAVFAAPANAQDSGSMQVGSATVGGGTAILDLPDVQFLFLFKNVQPVIATGHFTEADDFADEIGWNVNGSIEVPKGANRTVSLNGFWANIDDEDSATCSDSGRVTHCVWFPLVEGPAIFSIATGANQQIVSTAKRDVDLWGASLESKWHLNPGVMGVTQAPHRRTFALGADIRGIDQDLDVALRFVNAPANIGPATYTEDLDTRYYEVYAAWES